MIFLAALTALSSHPQRAAAQSANDGTAAKASAAIDVNVPAQSLSDALVLFGRQANLQLFFSPDLVSGKTAPAVRGVMTAEAALSALLQNSGISYRRSGIQGYVLMSASEKKGRDTGDRTREPACVGAGRSDGVAYVERSRTSYASGDGH